MTSEKQAAWSLLERLKEYEPQFSHLQSGETNSLGSPARTVSQTSLLDLYLYPKSLTVHIGELGKGLILESL